MRSRRGIYFIAPSPTLLLISGTPGVGSSTTATPAGTENIGVYLAIAIFPRVNIVCERVAEVVKDV